MPLSATLIAVVLVPFLVVLGVTGVYGTRLLERYAAERMQEDIELIARAIRLPVSKALEQGSDMTVRQALESVFSINRVYGVYVYDERGNTVYSSGTEGAAMQRVKAQRIVAEGDDRSEFLDTGHEQVFSYFIPLIDTGQRVIGLLQVTRRGSDFDEYLAEVQQRSITIIAVAALLLTLIIAAGHRWAVGQHINTVSKSLLRIQEAEADHRIASGGPREFRVLARGINRMLDAISESNRRLATQYTREAVLREKLHQSQKLAALGQLAAGVAHELGSPLSTIDGKAQRALRDKTLEQSVQQTFMDIRTQAARMEHTIRQLLDFGRTNPLSLRTISANHPLLSAIADCTDVETRAPRVDVTAPEGVEALRIRVDVVRIEQALINLLRNALQAARSQVTATIKTDTDWVHYLIEDDGSGVPAEALDHLFEPFFTTKPVGQGTGLGLAVAMTFAREHGGSVELVKSVGRTIFRLSLPRQGNDIERGAGE